MRTAVAFWVELGLQSGVAARFVLARLSASNDALIDVALAGRFELVPDLVRLGAVPRLHCLADVKALTDERGRTKSPFTVVVHAVRLEEPRRPALHATAHHGARSARRSASRRRS